MKEPRLIPLVAAAALALLCLKAIHFAVDGLPRGDLLAFGAAEKVDPITTGSSAAPAGHGEPAKGEAPESRPQTKITVSEERPTEAKPLAGQELLSEIGVLQRLAERRKVLEQRERELETREGLLKATEGKIEQRIDALKSIEGQIGTAVEAKEGAKSQELADLVKMYEAMKAKDAARVFDRLDTGLLVDIARQMSPRRLADVVAKMSPEAAEKLTVALANRGQRAAPPPPTTARELPKIEGRGG